MGGGNAESNMDDTNILAKANAKASKVSILWNLFPGAVFISKPYIDALWYASLLKRIEFHAKGIKRVSILPVDVLENAGLALA